MGLDLHAGQLLQLFESDCFGIAFVTAIAESMTTPKSGHVGIHAVHQNALYWRAAQALLPACQALPGRVRKKGFYCYAARCLVVTCMRTLIIANQA